MEKKKIESSKFIQRANVIRMDIFQNIKKYQPSFYVENGWLNTISISVTISTLR